MCSTPIERDVDVTKQQDHFKICDWCFLAMCVFQVSPSTVVWAKSRWGTKGKCFFTSSNAFRWARCMQDSVIWRACPLHPRRNWQACCLFRTSQQHQCCHLPLGFQFVLSVHGSQAFPYRCKLFAMWNEPRELWTNWHFLCCGFTVDLHKKSYEFPSRPRPYKLMPY